MLKLNYKLIQINLFLVFFCFLFFYHPKNVYSHYLTPINVFSNADNRIYRQQITNIYRSPWPLKFLFNVDINLTDEPELQINSLAELKQNFVGCFFPRFLLNCQLVSLYHNADETRTIPIRPISSENIMANFIDFSTIQQTGTEYDYNIKFLPFSPNEQNTLYIRINVFLKRVNDKLILSLKYSIYGFAERHQKLLLTISLGKQIFFRRVTRY